MSSRTSSRSTRTTVPVTTAPSSTDTRVASMASAKLPPRSSSTIWRGVYPDSALTSPSAAVVGAVESVVWASDTNGSAFFGVGNNGLRVPLATGQPRGRATRRVRARVAAAPDEPLRTRGEEQELGRADGRRIGGVGARSDRPYGAHLEPGAVSQQAELPRREAG